LARANEQLELRVEQRTTELSKFSTVVENSPMMVVITDSNGIIEYINPRFSEITGYKADEVIGKNPSIWRSPKTSRSKYKDLWKTISRGLLWSGELCNLRKDGSEFWVLSSIGAFLSESDEIVNYIAVQEDITEKKQAEKDLMLAKISAEQANHAKSEFLANMSHELRTPLNAIIGFSQLSVIDKSLAEQQKKNSREIYKAGRHLLSLIDDVLDLTRIEIGKVTLNIQPIEVKVLVHECYELIRNMALEKDVQLDFSNYQCACLVQADYVRLKQIVINVLSNAIKYTKSPGSIQLSCTDSNKDEIVIKVIDTGEGISNDNMNKLFEPFNRLGKQNTDIEGTGIGLVISKKFIEMMGGSIQVESTLGQGSTFSIILPRVHNKDNVEVNPFNESATVISTKKSNYKLFYVEDNSANVKLIKELVAIQNDWTFSYATTAEEGIKLIKKNPPDVILMDINLPEMNGIQACQEIKNMEQLKHIPIIAVSAGAMKENIKTAMKVDFYDYITKPIDIKNLIQIINQLKK